VPKTLLFLSHRLTSPQERELEALHGGQTSFLNLPERLQVRFSQVPAGKEFPWALLSDLVAWLEEQACFGDQAVIQGDWGLTVGLVDACRKRGIRALHATTVRQAREVPDSDGGVLLEHVFLHQGFREYPPSVT